MTAPMVLVRHQDATTIISLNRPERSNSLVPELLTGLRSALVDVAASDARAVVLAAEGPVFSTGGDVWGFWEHRDNLEAYASDLVGTLNEVMLAMITLPQPIVTPVQGMVTGGSLGLVLASDVVLMSPGAIIRPWYGTVGFSPDGGWTALLPRIIGPRRAAGVLLSDDTISASDAVAWGLAYEVVPDQELLVAAMRYASVIEGLVPGAVGRAKRLLAGDAAEVATGLEAERMQFVEQVVTDEARSGMARFLGVKGGPLR